LVVLGSHGHSALGNLVMGSVATQVLAECKVPALLVR
jgi:nucleotide-binding universal stress UspA family protein